MNFSKSLGQTVIRFTDLQTIIKNLTALKKSIIFFKGRCLSLIEFNDLGEIVKELTVLIRL